MAAPEKITIALTADQAGAIREAVEAGDYASSNDAVQDAVREWTERRDPRGLDAERLGQLWDEGIVSGRPVDGEEAAARIRAKLEKHIASRGA